MKQLSFFLLFLPAFSGLFAQRTIRCVVFNHSYDPPRPENFAKITPLSGGNTVEQGTDAGIFELRITGVKPGDRLELIVSKDGHQILGPNPTIFTYAVPADEGEPIKIAIIKNSDFDSRKADYEKAIEKRIGQANKALLDSIARLQTQKLSEDERAGLTKFIGQQNREIEELRKNKDELAAKLAQVDLDQASEFAQLALKKFRDEGDVKAALALMPDEKLDQFWDNMLTQEEKVKRARQQGVENYMIRARLLTADFQFPLAYKNYLEAIDKDSTNLDNLWEVAYFLDAQNQHQRAILLYEKCLVLAKTGAQRAAFLNNLGNLYKNNNRMKEAEKAYSEALSGYRILSDKNPDAFLPDVASTLNNLGIFYSANQKMPEAEKAYSEALSIYRQLAAKNPDAFLPDVATTLNNLGIFYSDNQKMPEAEKAYNEALDIRRQLAAKNPDAFLPNVASTLNNLGVFFKDLKNYSKALDHYEEALRIRQTDLLAGKTYFFKDWIQVFSNISRVKDSTESKKLYPLTVRARYLLAVSCDSLKEIDERIFNQSVSEYGSLSWWALFARDYPLAEHAALRCLALDPEQTYVYTNLGHAHLLRGDFAKAKAAYFHLKGKKNGDGEDYKIVLEKDFKDLEAEGITHKGMAEIRKWLREEW